MLYNLVFCFLSLVKIYKANKKGWVVQSQKNWSVNRPRICKPFKEPRNRFPALWNRFLGSEKRLTIWTQATCLYIVAAFAETVIVNIGFVLAGNSLQNEMNIILSSPLHLLHKLKRKQSVKFPDLSNIPKNPKIWEAFSPAFSKSWSAAFQNPTVEIMLNILMEKRLHFKSVLPFLWCYCYVDTKEKIISASVK